jgi:pimeloyl-ACP methyl ester carboxylesterase
MLKQLPSADAAILSRPEILSLFVRDAANSSRTAGRAQAQDFEVFATAWGFDFGDIKVPVFFWQGDADRNVPPGHAVLQHDSIPGSTLHTLAGEGHFFVVDRLGDVLSELKPA